MADLGRADLFLVSLEKLEASTGEAHQSITKPSAHFETDHGVNNHLEGGAEKSYPIVYVVAFIDVQAWANV